MNRVELHTHLEGAVTPDRLRQLAARHGQPGVLDVLSTDGAAYRFTDFRGFLHAYRHVTAVLRTPADFHALALDLGAQLAADGVIYAEVTVSAGVLRRRAVPVQPVLAALAEAAAEIEATRGVVVRWIPDAVRQWGLDEARRVFDDVLAAGARELGVVGFGLGGDESAGPADHFAPLFSGCAPRGSGSPSMRAKRRAPGP